MASAKRDGLFKRGRFWWVRTDPIDGKPRSSGFTDREAARLWRADRERKAADPSNAVAAEATLEEWLGRYLAMIERTGSLATVAMYELKLGHFLRVWGADCRLLSIDPVKVDAYVQRRRGEPNVSDHTISKEVALLVRMLKLAKRGGAYTGPIEVLKPLDLSSGYKPRTRALNREQVAALLSELEGHTRALVAVCVALGCRRSEGMRLTPADIDLEAGFAHIRGTKTEDSDRLVPVLSVFRPMLELALPLLPYRATTTNVNREVMWACKRAGIEHASFNDFRRTHATLLLEHGVDRDHVRRLLGHTTAKLVDTVYGQPKPAAIAALVEPLLLGAAPVTAVTNTRHSLAKTGDPSENRTRVTGVRGLALWAGRKATRGIPAETCQSGGPERADRRWRRRADEANTLHWFGRATRAEQVAAEVLA
jgi:integrase